MRIQRNPNVIDLYKWHVWFAWFPVKTPTSWVWLENVLRVSMPLNGKSGHRTYLYREYNE